MLLHLRSPKRSTVDAPHVAIVAGAYPISLVNFRGPLLQSLRQLGWRAIAVAGEGDTNTEAQVKELGAEFHVVRIERAGLNPIRDLMTLYEFLRLFRTFQPEVFIGYTVKPVVYGLLAAWVAGIPRRYALITGLGYAFIGGGALRGLLQSLVGTLYRIALRTATKVFFENPDDEAYFRKLGIISPAVPSVIINGSGVDTTAFAVVPLPARKAAAFLMVGRLLGDKGVREYVQAARTVKGRFPGAAFRLVGWIDKNPDSIESGELDEWVREGVIEFLGKLDDVRPAIAACNVYVLPSYREGLPRTVLEAMAMGRAVITTDAPGCRETVVEGENGFLVPVKSINALAAAMERFVTDPELAQRMGKRSREIAVARFDVDEVNAILLKEMGIA